MISLPQTWSAESLCLQASSEQLDRLANDIHERVCRTDFSKPGFCLVKVSHCLDSVAFRQTMVDLKVALAEFHTSKTSESLIYLSAARFDQQTSTKPHLDGGPDECFLMLGYEPSTVGSEIEITDYARCAHEFGLTPKEFMARHNPMFRSGFEMLRPYATRIPCFASNDYQIVCINNSSAPFDSLSGRWQGTLHTAKILSSDESARRIINSTMIARAPFGETDAISQQDIKDFVTSSVVHRKGYDKAHLEDDH
jgi:hypothetical protein